MQNDIEQLIASVGAIAEITALYKRSLTEQGIPDGEAIRYTVAFVTAVMGGGNRQA